MALDDEEAVEISTSSSIKEKTNGNRNGDNPSNFPDLDSAATDKLDMTENNPPLDHVLRSALFDPKNRMFVLRLEKSVLSFLRNTNVQSLDLDPMNSFFRLVSHKVADYYNIGHTSSIDGSFVIYFKQPKPLVIPHVRLSDIEGDGTEELEGLKDSGASSPSNVPPVESMKKLVISKRPAVLLKKDRDQSSSRQSSASPGPSPPVKDDVGDAVDSVSNSDVTVTPSDADTTDISATVTGAGVVAHSRSRSPTPSPTPPHFKILTNEIKSKIQENTPIDDSTLSSDESDGQNQTDEKSSSTLKGLSFEAKVAAYEQARARIFKNFEQGEEQELFESNKPTTTKPIDDNEYSRDYVRSYTSTTSLRNDNPQLPPTSSATNQIYAYSNRSNLSDPQLYAKFETSRHAVNPVSSPLPYSPSRTSSAGVSNYQYPMQQGYQVYQQPQQSYSQSPQPYPGQPQTYQYQYNYNPKKGAGYVYSPSYNPESAPFNSYNTGSYFAPQGYYSQVQGQQLHQSVYTQAGQLLTQSHQQVHQQPLQPQQQSQPHQQHQQHQQPQPQQQSQPQSQPHQQHQHPHQQSQPHQQHQHPHQPHQPPPPPPPSKQPLPHTHPKIDYSLEFPPLPGK